MNDLTKKQAEVVKFLRIFIKRAGFPPTRQEICDHFGWKSTNNAEQHLRLIEAKGYIALSSDRRNTIEILK